ncbi:MAG: MotA/TolQ/ExbB proton channel family protein [Cytophagales bacterium]|nr:MotA/TolQ/ExbB proton channel family protein [Cytophagales bacterium]
MKKLFISGILACATLFASPVFAQGADTTAKAEVVDTNAVASTDSAIADSSVADSNTAQAEPVTTPTPAATEEVAAPQVEETKEVSQQIKDKFIEGGVEFMGVVLICLILGLAIAIERIIALNLATTNTKKLLKKVKKALSEGGVTAARNVVAKVPGPVASIFAQGLLRAEQGESIEQVEKSIIANGGVEMGKLEKGLTWVSLFISLAPMLGFMGTVIGMIDAFDSIQNEGDIKIDQVAGGIKVALLTTVAGLIVAIILQVFYNYCVSKVDAIVGQMEEASIELVDTLIAYKENKK